MTRTVCFVLAACLFACGGRIATEDVPKEVVPGDAPGRPPQVQDARAPGDASKCVDAIGAEVTRHACVHGADGPFETIVLADSALSARDASRLHVAYRLAAVEGVRSGYVAYVPVRGGAHVLYTTQARVTQVRRGDGVSVPVVHRQAVTDCPSFEDAAVFELEAGSSYDVAISLDGATGLAFFEHMGSFEEPWQSRCKERDR
jgi:hypothetical protein